MSKRTDRKTIPSTWQWVRLGEACEINPRRPEISRADDAPTSFVPMAAVSDDGQGIVRAIVRPYSEVKRGYTWFVEGDILFAKITPCMQNGKHVIAKGLLDGMGFGSTEFHVFRPKSGVMAEWLRRFLIQPEVLSQAANHLTGAVGQQRIPEDYLAKLEIPLPPLSEQHRIGRLVDQWMSVAEQGRIAAVSRLAAAKSLRQAYLRAAFESPEARGWPLVALRDIARLQRGKFTPRPRNDPRYYKGKYPWIQTGDVESSNKYILTHQNTLNDLGLSVSKLFSKGTLVITIAATIGAVGILRFDSCMPDSLVGITPIDGKSCVEYLYYALDFARRQIQSIAPQMAQANLKLALLAPFCLRIPPLAIQEEVARRLDQQIGIAFRMQEASGAQLAAINALPPTLLRRVFTGEL